MGVEPITQSLPQLWLPLLCSVPAHYGTSLHMTLEAIQGRCLRSVYPRMADNLQHKASCYCDVPSSGLCLQLRADIDLAHLTVQDDSSECAVAVEALSR